MEDYPEEEYVSPPAVIFEHPVDDPEEAGAGEQVLGTRVMPDGRAIEYRVEDLVYRTRGYAPHLARNFLTRLDLSPIIIEQVMERREAARQLEADIRRQAMERNRIIRQMAEAQIAAESQCCTIMHKGGRVKKDGLHLLQKGEIVLPRETFLSKRDKERRY